MMFRISMKNLVRVWLVLLLSSTFVLAQTAEEKAKLAKKISTLKASLEQQIDASELATPEIKAYIKTYLLSEWQNPVYVKAIEEQNAKSMSLDDIKKLDEEWINAEDELPIHKQMMDNSCAKEIIRLATMQPVLGEIFVMDNQGANVAQNALTSDYWQGDEPKWQKSFNNGQGGVDIAEMKFDKSTNIVDQKVSLPVINKQGDVIGAVCYGINQAYAKSIGMLLLQLDQSDKAGDQVKTYAKQQLIPFCMEAIIAKETSAQNEKGISLDEIKKIDQEWIDAEDILPVHDEKLGNECAKEIGKLVQKRPEILEAFVMDNQGANVGQNKLTSDYWQGDEAKWQNVYNQAKGGIEIGDIEFDKSANAQLQQISLPVFDKKGTVIGAVCFGLKEESVKAFQIAADKAVTPQ